MSDKDVEKKDSKIVEKKEEKVITRKVGRPPLKIVDEKGVPTKNKITKEIVLELRINHLELQLLKKDFEKINLQIENFERAKLLATMQRNDVKNKIHLVEKRHQDFLSSIERETGIDIRNKTINPDTFEVMD